jgi:hypothetical protein
MRCNRKNSLRCTATPKAARLGRSGANGLCAAAGGPDEWFSTRVLTRAAQAQGALAQILRGLRLQRGRAVGIPLSPRCPFSSEGRRQPRQISRWSIRTQLLASSFLHSS